ncbi:phage head closure protein [Bacillus mobilis]|uniref:Phage head closure protein n=1 Tax=Bacillus mobilis TaxID=2026190 RepID=A0ABV4S3X3_9BACI
MNHRITIQTLTTVEDELGQSIEEWHEFKKVWCAIKTVQGREYFAAASTQNENTYRFIIRHTNEISPLMKIDFNGRMFEITSVLNDDESNKTITIIAKEKL